MEFRWKMKLSGLFYQLATLVNKIKSLKFHFPTQFHGNTKISSGKWEIHWFFDKIIEQSTIFGRKFFKIIRYLAKIDKTLTKMNLD